MAMSKHCTQHMYYTKACINQKTNSSILLLCQFQFNQSKIPNCSCVKLILWKSTAIDIGLNLWPVILHHIYINSCQFRPSWHSIKCNNWLFGCLISMSVQSNYWKVSIKSDTPAVFIIQFQLPLCLLTIWLFFFSHPSISAFSKGVYQWSDTNTKISNSKTQLCTTSSTGRS